MAHHKKAHKQKHVGGSTLSGMAASMMRKSEDQLEAKKAAKAKKIADDKEKEAEDRRVEKEEEKMGGSHVHLDLSGDKPVDDDDDDKNAAAPSLDSFMDDDDEDDDW